MRRLPSRISALLLIPALSLPVQADFCNGKRYGFWDMSISDRILAAREATAEAMETLNQNRLYLRTDLQIRVREERERMEALHQRLIQDTQSLCLNRSAQSGKAISYQSIRLESGAEIQTQLHLNHLEYQAQKQVLAQLREQDRMLEILDQRLERRHGTLRLVRRHLETLTASPTPETAKRILSDACQALHEVRQVHEQWPSLDVDELLRESRETVEISDHSKAVLIQQCRFEPHVPVKNPKEKQHTDQSSWWKFW